MRIKRQKNYAEGDTGSNTGGGTHWWDSLLSNLGGMLTGAGNLAAGIIAGQATQTGATNYYNNQVPQQTKSNVGVYFIVVVVVVDVLI
jgi:hypothetical protein